MIEFPPRILRALAAVLLVLVASPAAAQSVSALDWLAGNWRGAGTMFGNASEATFSVRPALGGRFLEFSYRAGPFEGRAFYAPASEGRWQARWFDNRGITFPIAATLAERQLTSEWGDAATERGRTVYRVAEDGRLHITDSVLRPDGQYRDFASHILSPAD